MTIAIGKRIRAAREAHGWSQEQLADRVGATQSTIDRIESGLTHRSRYMHQIVSELGLGNDVSEYVEYSSVPRENNITDKLVIWLESSLLENIDKVKNDCDFRSREETAVKLIEQGLMRHDDFLVLVERFYVNLKGGKSFKSVVRDVLGDHPLIEHLAYDKKSASLVLTNLFSINIDQTGIAKIWDARGNLYVHEAGKEPAWADPENIAGASQENKKEELPS